MDKDSDMYENLKLEHKVIYHHYQSIVSIWLLHLTQSCNKNTN